MLEKNNVNMKFLTFEQIKAHLRLDDEQAEAERDLLEAYGDSAETTVENLTGRDYTSIMSTYGEVPKPLVIAALMLVDVNYQHRSPLGQQTMSIVPYTFDLLIKPYMRLASDTNENNNIQGYGGYCNI